MCKAQQRQHIGEWPPLLEATLVFTSKTHSFTNTSMSEKLLNTIQLVNAKVLFAIKHTCTLHSKSHYDVEVELRHEFKTQKEYLEFRKSWKALYMDLSFCIRSIRPLVRLACQPNMATDTYHNGRYHWPQHNMTNTLFFWRMRAKALLKALAMAKRVAGEQREQQCSHPRNPGVSIKQLLHAGNQG